MVANPRSGLAGTMPAMSCVTIEYENGLTITYEGEALDQWESTYYQAQEALIQVRLMTHAAQMSQAAQAESENSSGSTDTIQSARSLRDALTKKS